MEHQVVFGNKLTILTLFEILKDFTFQESSSYWRGGVLHKIYVELMIKGQKKSELILYVALWAVLFAAPVISMLVGDFWDWQGVWNAWGLLSMFCVTFFIHNFLIAPLLVYGNRKWTFGCLEVLLFVCFLGYQIHFRPHRPEPRNEEEKPRMEQGISQNQQSPDRKNPKLPYGQMQPPNNQTQRPYGQQRPPHELQSDKRPPHDEISLVKRENTEVPAPPLRPEDGKGDRMRPDKKFEPPRAFGGQDSVAFIIMALLLGLNVGIKYFFKSLDDKKRIKELERENLNRQLEYLKYQINPHFFMNTLNNIHALVDIDPEEAKYTIEVLSKLMRYVLYEGNKTMAPLQKELDFIRHYVDLMKIRYTDKVRISVSLPTSVPDIQVPSLLFTTFVENAFKHGVSYQQDSFIEISVRVDETAQEIYFLCNNSRKPEAEEKRKGGVGLENAKKRLALIYGEAYELKIDVKPEEYRLLLRLPIRQI